MTGSPAPRLLALLEAAAARRRDLRLAAFPDGIVDWALDSGLGALLEWCVAEDPDAATARRHPDLRGAALTARVLAEESREALLGVLDACAALGARATLLKGASIAHQHYPAPHLRPMRDLDVLVEPAAAPALEAALMDQGYKPAPGRLDPGFWAGHHHGVPLVHPQTGVWVEVHRRLFRADGPWGQGAPFAPESVSAERRPADFCGRSVYRLSDELQLVYVAAHWALSFGVTGAEGGLVALLDTLYLLQAPLDWERILAWRESSPAGAPLHLILGYLSWRGLASVPDAVAARLARSPHGLGRAPQAILQRLLERYLVEGRPFGRILPLHRFERVWETLLGPGPPARRLVRAAWSARPWWRGRAQPPAETRLGRSDA